MKNSDRQNRLSQPFTSNSPLFFNLPLGGKILLGRVVLHGTVQLTTTTAGTVMGLGGPTRLIKRIKVRANPTAGGGPNGGPRYPGGTLVDVDPSSLLLDAMYQRNGVFQADQGGSTLGAGATGTYNVYLSIPIYWADATLRRQVITALNADPAAYQSIQVEVDTADITNCFTGWTGTANYTGLAIDWIDDRENFAGDTYVRFMESHDLLLTAANQRGLDAAMPQDGVFESVLYQGWTTAQQNLADTILQRVHYNGDAIDYDEYAQDIRQQMFDDGWATPGAGVTGLYRIDFTDGLVGGAINAATLQLWLQYANPGGSGQDTLRVFTRRLFSPYGYTPAGGAVSAQNQ